MPSVRILHASDLHLASTPNNVSPADRFTPGTIKDALINQMLASSHDPSILLSFAKFVYQQSRKGSLDAVLLSGDISTTGAREDLDQAFDFIHAPVEPGLGWQDAAGKARLSEVNTLVWLLPGNHDRYETSFYGYTPGGVEFDEVFKSDWQGPVQTYELLIKAGLTVTLVAADFNLIRARDSERLLGWLAQGNVYPDILNKLEDATNKLPEHARQCVIWAVHFPPAFPRVSPYLQLIDGDLLTHRANSCGVKAVLAGHTHDAVKYRRPNMTFDVFCAGTASQAFSPEGNHFRIIEVNSDNAGRVTINTEEYRFNKVKAGVITDRSGFRRVS